MIRPGPIPLSSCGVPEPVTLQWNVYDDSDPPVEPHLGVLNWHAWQPLVACASVPPRDLETVIQRVSELIVGTREDRFGPRPTKRDRNIIRDRVRRRVESSEPIDMFVMWGAIKHYVRDEEQGIDLAEFFAVQQFLRLREAVCSVYPPGIRVRFYLEDFGVLYEDGGGRSPEVRGQIARNIETYLGGLEALVELVGPGWLEAIRVGDLLRRKGDLAEVERRADQFLCFLHEFWRESDSVSAGGVEGLRSYRMLQQAGWSGTIPPSMRRHYLKRMACLYPQASDEEKIDRLLRYFAIVLLYAQTGVPRDREEGSIKVSLFKPAPGIPCERIRGRIHLRTLPRSICPETMPPWTAKGCLRLFPDGKIQPSTVSFRVSYQQGRRFSEGRITLNDRRRTVTVRSDLYLPDSIPGGRPVRLARYPDLEPSLADRWAAV